MTLNIFARYIDILAINAYKGLIQSSSVTLCEKVCIFNMQKRRVQINYIQFLAQRLQAFLNVRICTSSYFNNNIVETSGGVKWNKPLAALPGTLS